MKERLKLVPPVEKVRLKELRTGDGTAYVGLEVEYHATDGERCAGSSGSPWRTRSSSGRTSCSSAKSCKRRNIERAGAPVG